MVSLSNLNTPSTPSASNFSPVPSSEDVYMDGEGLSGYSESSVPSDAATVEEEPETVEEEPEEEPSDRITPPGGTVASGGSLYYRSQSGTYIVKTSLDGVYEASEGLAETVKNDIPEASNFAIWRVVFNQSLYDGVQVYGSTSDMSQFNVLTNDGEAYILNAFGDYEGCPVSSIFGTDFSEDGAVYIQCLIVASASEPRLVYVGSSGSEYNTNPVDFKN